MDKGDKGVISCESSLGCKISIEFSNHPLYHTIPESKDILSLGKFGVWRCVA